jgi:RHS repeat-associated protein
MTSPTSVSHTAPPPRAPAPDSAAIPAPAPSAPALSLPKGGGALRGIGEKFTANPATGTATLTVPLATSPGRSGFGPTLTLSYDSARGNGLFGLGWSLSLPAITRKTDDGLPRYAHDPEDVVVLSGSEDLVEVLTEHAGTWCTDPIRRVVDGRDFEVRRYRPRIEGLFARIERWTDCGSGDTHWRSITPDNVTTRYGLTPQSRIADPEDPRRVFSWLVCDSFDDTGNAVVYEYKAEDDDGVDLAVAHERGRTPPARAVNRHLKRIRYGNRRSRLDHPGAGDWMFEVVFDYGEHDLEVPTPQDARPWDARPDPFSSYRAGFEVRTHRLCRRVLMFHHFPQEAGVGRDCLVRSTDLSYRPNPAATLLTAVEQGGFRRAPGGGYVRRCLPPLEVEYSQAEIQEEVRTLEPPDLALLPDGIGGAGSRWLDLDGVGLSGVLCTAEGGWNYVHNRGDGRFGPRELVAAIPSTATLGAGQQLMDLAGDGRMDLVDMTGPAAGFYERTDDNRWTPFRPFRSRPNMPLGGEHVRFADLTGDGHADLLVLDDDVLTWLPSLAKNGFGPARRVFGVPSGSRGGPRLLVNDARQAVHLADMSGDGQPDLVLISNTQVVYWPNLGYGRFGTAVRMDDPPAFDEPDQFDPRRLRLADVDGAGPTDVIYLHRDGATIHRNLAGNRWAPPHHLRTGFPRADTLSQVAVIDLLGRGASLVWSSPLPAEQGRQVRFVELMPAKPFLARRIRNNLGAQTEVTYVPSTRFFLADRAAGRPWLTRMPFPVYVVERVETVDAVSGNRFVTRYAYHHGDYDGVEREARGFGMVEQWDTEQRASDPDATGEHVPPVLTRTWFHTGVFTGSDTLSRRFAREYFREADQCAADPDELLLPDTVLPATVRRPGREPLRHRFTADELRQACRALRGSVLRQEVYALDGGAAQTRPYTITERSYTIECLQPVAGCLRHAVFVTHPRETLTASYERALYQVGGERRADPRVTHELVLAVDDFGNVLRSASVGYGRRFPDGTLPPADRIEQGRLHLVATEHRFTNAVDEPDAHRVPLRAESQAFEVRGLPPAAHRPHSTNPFGFDELDRGLAGITVELPYEVEADDATPTRRLVEHGRTLYRRDDLDGPLPLGRVESMALPLQDYRLVLTAGLRESLYGARVDDATLAAAGYVRLPCHDGWWTPSGRVSYSPGDDPSPAAERAFARRHFFRPRRYTDPFGAATEIAYDTADLLVTQTRDAVGNTVDAVNDYRVLQPWLLVDPNGNRGEAAFDALGMVVGTAMRGKVGERVGDSLTGFEPDLDAAAVAAHLADPLAAPHALLGAATTRLVYDLFAFRRDGSPAVVATLSRETSGHALAAGEQARIQQGFAYSDGFGREVQHKLVAEPEPGGSPRWVGSGWTIFNNKGKPVRQYEPFFTSTHRFEFATLVGVSSVLCYDPVERVVATLHPNETWEKVVFDAWQQVTWDVNDTVRTDPRTDPDVGGNVAPVLSTGWVGWFGRRADGELGAAEQVAAQRAAAHAATPTRSWLDTLGRVFRTAAHNRTDGIDEQVPARLLIDIEGNERAVVDALHRVVVRYRYDQTGGRVAQVSMEAGERLLLLDVGGNPVLTWSSRGSRFRVVYDALRRPVRTFVTDGEGAPERLHEQTEYGEGAPGDRARNLRSRVHRQFDGAGVVTNEAFDFLGNLARSSRRLAREYRSALDWSGAVSLEDAVHRTATGYDALSRPVELTAPDGSLVRPRYDEAGQLDGLDARLRGAAEPTPFLVEVDHNARGQRVRCRYGNGVETTYGYDSLTFRLRRLRSVRGGSDVLQDLAYTYDPAGNIIRIDDGAQQNVFFRNRRVDPSADYVYDAMYRLVRASGREHLAGTPAPTSATDAPRVGLAQPSDGNALGRYVERYHYDAVGNMLRLAHRGADPAHPGWSRTFAYAEPSLLEPERVSNRLSTTTTAGGAAVPSTYDEHGNTTSQPELPVLRWDVDDQLAATARQVVGGGAARETTFYVYDTAGQRVRKVTDRATGRRRAERVYLGGFEVYREFGHDDVVLERETLHLTDDEQRVATVETRTIGDGGPVQLQRYQLGNHLGSSSVELDAAAEIISYEEYYPYGGTAYQAARSRTEAPKRYRYTAKERDEESGLYYHGARYYAPWLARWVSAEPEPKLRSEPNLYLFAGGQPVGRTDPDGRDWKDFAKGLAVGAGTALVGVAVVAAVIATAPITIPASVVIGAVAVGTTVTAATVVQSARQRDLLNRPISREQAHFQAGTALGGLFVSGASGPIAGGLSSAARGATSLTPQLVPAGGSVAVAAAPAIAEAIPQVVGAAVSVASPVLMAASQSGGGGGSREGTAGPAPERPPVANKPLGPPAPGRDVKAALHELPEEALNKVLARVVRRDVKGRPFGTPQQPRSATVDEFNPQIQQVKAADIEKALEPKHGLRLDQAASVRKLSNEELIRFRAEDPISALRGGTDRLSQTGGHHRAAEITRRVATGELAPETPVEILLHD